MFIPTFFSHQGSVDSLGSFKTGFPWYRDFHSFSRENATPHSSIKNEVPGIWRWQNIGAMNTPLLQCRPPEALLFGRIRIVHLRQRGSPCIGTLIFIMRSDCFGKESFLKDSVDQMGMIPYRFRGKRCPLAF